MWIARPGWRSLAGIIVSAALLGLYARGGNAYLLGFIALVPWLLALNATRTVAGAAGHGLAMSIAFLATALAWFGIAIGTYTGIGATIGIVALLLAAPLLQPQFLAFALVRHLVGRRHGAIVRALAGASAWVATEWLVPKLLGDTLGHGLFPSYLLRQIADVGGAAGLTFLLILINEAIAAAVTHRREGARASIKPLAIAASIVALMAGYGAMRLSALTTMPEDSAKPLRVGMVQSNIVDYERLRREMGAYDVVRHVLDTHYAMSREAIARDSVDALLWSETVYPTTFGKAKSEAGAELDREILDFVTASGVPLVFGTYDLDASGEYNAAAFVEPSAGRLGVYRKTRLFLFTEYVPAWLDGPTLRGLLPWTGAWRPGDGARVFPLRTADGREIPVLPMICLDDVDTGLAIEGARQGAQAILGMSNDSWFTKYPLGARLHLNVAAFRSIETRMPQLRVTNNGISAVIDRTGTVTAATAIGEQALLVGELSATPPPATLMVTWGDWVGRAGLVWLLLLAAIGVARALRERAARRTITTTATTDAQTNAFQADVVVLSPLWRAMAGLLRVFARGTLLWMGANIVLGHDAQANSLSQIWMFAAMVLAPEAAAWAILRAFAATARIENGVLVLEQRERRIEISVGDIAAAEPWTLPLPNTGLWLKLASGRRWSHGIALTDPTALLRALVVAGATPALIDTFTGRAADYARTRAAVPRRRLDHPALKFALFALVPALPAFHLHQHIAFGGVFGEYYTYGMKAYLTALLIWWASWAINLMVYAAGLRLAIETGTLLSLAVRPAQAIALRKALEFIARLLFYIGVPVWLAMRLWPW
jgi:apolipoprotein N-acyltransferase